MADKRPLMFDEKQNISQVLRGNLEAFGSLVKEYQQLVFHVIATVVKIHADKQDVSQEVFIKVYKNLHSFHFQSRLSTWIAAIAYRTALNYVRDRPKESSIDNIAFLETIPVTDLDPVTLAEKKDLNNYIQRLVLQLPAQYRIILVLYHVDEFSYLEIADILGMPEGTVKNYLFRARRLLKDKLKPYIKYE